jgi:hypothetical protein
MLLLFQAGAGFLSSVGESAGAKVTLKESFDGGYVKIKTSTYKHVDYSKWYLEFWQSPISSAEVVLMLSELIAVNSSEMIPVYSNILPPYAAAANLFHDMGFVEPDIDLFPEQHTISRAEFIKLLSVLKGIAPLPTASRFSDANGHWAEGYIAAFEALGYLKGYPDGTCQPDRALSGAECVTFINRIVDVRTDYDYTSSFLRQDIPKSYWAFADISKACMSYRLNDRVGHEFEQGTDRDLDPPKIDRITAETLDADQAIFRLSILDSDLYVHPDGNPFFWWNAGSGVFIESSADNRSVVVAPEYNVPFNTYDPIYVIVGVGDNLGCICMRWWPS